MKIYLLGFMGAGKSVIGKNLAEKLKCTFLDLDKHIEEVANKSITEIFTEEGEAAFRQMEFTLLREFKTEPSVIATGGGLPCFNDNLQWMNQHGITVFLDVPVASLVKRLSKEKHLRPLLAGREGSDLLKFIDEKLAERRPFYEQAQFIFKGDIPVIDAVNVLANYFARFRFLHKVSE